MSLLALLAARKGQPGQRRDIELLLPRRWHRRLRQKTCSAEVNRLALPCGGGQEGGGGDHTHIYIYIQHLKLEDGR